MGLAWPLCSRLRPPSERGRPARPQPPPPASQVGSDRRPGRRPGDLDRGGRHHPQTRHGQVEMIWVRRVARRGALKARVAAAEQLHGVLSSALKSSANRCSGARPRPWVAPVQPCGQAADQHQRRHQSQPAAPGSALATTPSRTRPPRPPAAGAGRRSRAQPGRPARDRVDTAGQLLVTARDNPQRLRSEAAFAQLWGAALIPASSAAPTVIGAIAAATVTPTVLWGGSLWSRCAATRRPGPSRTAHQPGSLQARHHALSQALHRPRALPAPHKPAPARPTRCLNRRHRHTRRISNDGAEREHAAHLPASRCLAALVALSGCAQAELG